VQLLNIPFNEYLALPGYSYSGIKNQGAKFEPTAKMQLGTDVHNYLLTPEHYDHKNAAIVKPIALALKQAIGPLFKYLQAEVAITADMVSQGFTMAYKGRIDLIAPGRLVVDVKVTELDIAKAIQFFGYDKQLSGYAIPTKCPAALIVAVNPKTFKTQIANIPIDSQWWEYQVIQNGEVL
jgi:hypothetical protein